MVRFPFILLFTVQLFFSSFSYTSSSITGTFQPLAHQQIKLVGFEGFANKLESYRAIKIGNTAPDIVFNGDVFRNGMVVSEPGKLSGISSQYVVVAFGSSDCPMCAGELQNIKALYPKWSRKEVEVVYVSMDFDKEQFVNKTREFPFLSHNDYRHWDSPPVLDYHVFATPTFYLLDATRKIILRPASVRQIDAWVDFYLKD